MRCLLKLAVVVGLAVLAQTLVRPGGVGDEYAFMARLYLGERIFGIPHDCPEMVDAAGRLMVRQGLMPERSLAACAHPSPRPDDDAAEWANATTANDKVATAAAPACNEVACGD